MARQPKAGLHGRLCLTAVVCVCLRRTQAADAFLLVLKYGMFAFSGSSGKDSRGRQTEPGPPALGARDGGYRECLQMCDGRLRTAEEVVYKTKGGWCWWVLLGCCCWCWCWCWVVLVVLVLVPGAGAWCWCLVLVPGAGAWCWCCCWGWG